MTHAKPASPLPGQTWRSSIYNAEAEVQPDGRFRLTTGRFQGTTLGPREHWDAEELADWRVVRGPMPCTFHIEVRTRSGKPGQTQVEHRVYTTVVNRNLDLEKDDWRFVLQRGVPMGAYMNITFDYFTPREVHEATGHAVYRESMRASDKRLRRIEDSLLFTRQDAVREAGLAGGA